MIYDKFMVLECGDKAILLEFGDRIDLNIFRQVQRMFFTLRNKANLGIVETVPCFRSLLIYYNPIITKITHLIEKIREIEKNLDNYELASSKLFKIPVVYGGEFGPDMKFVAEYHQVTKSNRHSHLDDVGQMTLARSGLLEKSVHPFHLCNHRCR